MDSPKNPMEFVGADCAFALFYGRLIQEIIEVCQDNRTVLVGLKSSDGINL